MGSACGPLLDSKRTNTLNIKKKILHFVFTTWRFLYSVKQKVDKKSSLMTGFETRETNK